MTEGTSRRTERMSDLIREEVAQFLIKGNKNPLIGFVTITGVKMTPDLQSARIFYTCYGSKKEMMETRIGLEDSSKRIRGHLAKVLKVRHIPTIEFVLDEGLEHSMKIQSLLGTIKSADEPTSDSQASASETDAEAGTGTGTDSGDAQ